MLRATAIPGPAPSGFGPQGAHALALRHRGGAIEVLWQLTGSSRQYSPSPSDFKSPSMRGPALRFLVCTTPPWPLGEGPRRKTTAERP